MQRFVLFGLVAVGLLVGCGQQNPGPRQVAVPPDDNSNGPFKPVVNVLPNGPGPVAPPPGKTIDDILASVGQPTGQNRYDASLMEALELLAQKKQTQALAALEAAKQAAKDADPAVQTDPIQQEIDRLKESMARQAAADATVQNIRAVLDDGRPEEAARLAGEALAQYGGSDAADDLLKLKREAEALLSARPDAADHRKKWGDEARAALDAKNLREAAVALEQALQQGDDADLKKQLDDVRARLSRYDDNRRRAEELRRDPASLEDAVAALQEAQKAWDTPDVQQQIADYTLALQTRRDRLGVADFEVRGDVGLADAGRTLADELLPAFKSRYDLVERGQLNKVVEELKLETADLNGGQNQAAVGRLSKLRYLVVASVTRLGGVSVNARLVDVRSGLVVQTARVTAPTADDLLPLLPQLATELTMTDEQKMAFEQQLATRAVAAPPVAVADVTPPPPPEVRADDQPPPPPVVTATPVSPPNGDIKSEDFQNLPPPPPPDQQPPVVVVEEPADAPVKLRLRHVCIELGDNLFRRGRYHDARVQFEMALNLGCDRRDVDIRLDRCAPFLPPPPPPEIVVVFAPPKPRLAILDLAVIGDPDVVPPVLGPWTADNLAPYFCDSYDVVDRETVCWYMNRLGLSLRDVLTDPVARRWLGRALGVRFFVLGDVRQTASFVVSTHLIDAECGYEFGWGRVHVHNPFELRLRLGDLVGQTLLDPAERRRRHEEAEAAEREQQRLAQLAEADRERALQESDNVPLLILEAQNRGDRGDLSVSIELLGRARKLRPDSIEINVLFDRFNSRHRRHEWEEDRKRQWEAQQAAIATAQQQQLALARAAEDARLQAAREAGARQEAEAQLLQQQRQQAFVQLQAQAQLAVQQQQFNQAVQLYQSALALRQTDAVFQALAQARAQADQAARAAAAQAAEQQAAAVQQQRDADLAQARLKLVEERHNQEAREQAERAAQAARDQGVYERLLDDGQRQLAKDQFDAAISSFQTARQLRRTDEAERLLSQALAEQAHATALKKHGQDELERQLAEEKARREKAEAEAVHNRELYEAALKLAQQAFAEKNYDVAEAKYEEAGKVFHSDVVLTSLQKVRSARNEAAAAAAAEQAKRDADAKKDAEFQRLSNVGVATLEKKNYDLALTLLNKANQLKPDDVTVLTALGKAEHERADAAVRAKQDAEAAQQEASFRQFLDGGKANLAAKRYDAAVISLKEAVRLKPGDKEAADALQQAEQAHVPPVKTPDQVAEATKNRDAYQKWMTDGRTALATKQYDAAVNAFSEAQKALPGDASSAKFLEQAESAKAAAAAAVAEAAKKHEEEAQRAAAVQKSLAQGRAALAAHDLDAASKAVAAAADKAPNDPDVKKVQQDLLTALTAAKAEAETRKKRDVQVQALKKKGADAQAAQRYDDAVQAFAEAGQLAPDDAAVKDLLGKAQKARADAQAAADQAAAKKAADERAAKVGQIVADARKALAAQDYDGAGKLLANAHKLSPDDAGVVKLQDDLAKASKETADKLKKQQADYALAMDAGKAAVRKGNYEGAVNSYTEALRIVPGDKDASTALDAATKAKATADAETTRKAAEAQRRADFNKLMGQGQTALTAKQYADAAKAFGDALKVQPDDPAAARALRDANQAAADAVRADGDRKKHEAAYADAMTAGRDAMTAKKYDDALKAFTEATKQLPDDKAAATAMKEAKTALDAAGATQKHMADYADAMKAGRAALTAKKYADAVKAFTDAGKFQPDDKDAAVALKDAQAAMDGDVKRRDDFNRLTTQGQTALKGGRFDEAAKAYADALKLQPDDPGATKGLHDANAAMDGAKSDADRKKRDAEYAAAIKAGRDAMASKKYADAVSAFGNAAKIVPGNKDAAAGLKDAQAAADAEAKKKMEDAKRLEDLSRLLTQGQAAMTAKHFDEAAKAFSDASKLDPNDPTAAKGLRDANAAMDGAKSDADKKKRDADYAAAIKAGHDALTAKKYDDAVKAFTDAGKITPGDKDAAAGLQSARDGAAADAKMKQDEAKRQEDFNRLLKQGQAAMAGARLDEAAKAYGDALKLQPADPTATKGLRDANAAMEAAKGDAEKKKREADYAAAMAAGRDAVKAKKYDDAVSAFTSAGKIQPGDKAAADALKAAQDAAAADAKKKMEEAKKRDDFNKLVTQGQAAMTASRFDDAVKAFGDATKLDPADASAAKGLHDATQAAQAMQAAQAAQAAKAATEKKRAADYAAAMASGHDAVKAKKYDDAVKAFTDAGKIQPGDKDAASALKDAQSAAAADAAAKAAEAKRQADFANFMTQGQTAQTGKKYDDAAKAFTAALQLQPGDAKATAGLQSAQFSQHLTAGQSLAAAKKFADAVKEYQAALAIFPDNADAKAALKRAQNNMP